MSFKITIPPTNLTLVEWFIKHKVSTKVCRLDSAIARAIDSTVEFH
jgi:hypothetical protein